MARFQFSCQLILAVVSPNLRLTDPTSTNENEVQIGMERHREDFDEYLQLQ